MDSTKPLEILVRPKDTLFGGKFARELVSLFDGLERFAVEASSEGLIIRTIWEPDLAQAYELIRSSCSGDVVWGEPRINYLHDLRRQEPVLLVEVQTPSNYVGNVIGDLMSRRGLMKGMANRSDVDVLRAEVPLAELRGYVAALAAMTNGQGSATADFHSYQTASRDPGPPDEPMSAALRA
jgi:hypothetical protein